MDQIQGFLPLLLLLLVFYFFLIRPQMQRQKKEKKFAQELKKGDRVVTKSGMHGKILDIVEDKKLVILETGAGKITFDQSAVSLELTQASYPPKK